MLNVEDWKEAVFLTIGMGGSKIEWGREDESVVKEEVRKALMKIKSGKAPGVDGIACEMLKQEKWHMCGKCMYELANFSAANQ